MAQIVNVVTILDRDGSVVNSFVNSVKRKKGILAAYDELLVLENNLPEDADLIISPHISTRQLLYTLPQQIVLYYILS